MTSERKLSCSNAHRLLTRMRDEIDLLYVRLKPFKDDRKTLEEELLKMSHAIDRLMHEQYRLIVARNRFMKDPGPESHNARDRRMFHELCEKAVKSDADP